MHFAGIRHRMRAVKLRMVAGMALFASTLVASDLPRAKNAPKIQVDGTRSRNTKVAGGDWDDRLQKVQFSAVVRNLELNKPAEGLKLQWWALAESLVDRKKLLVIDSGAADVSLSNKPDGREMRSEGREVVLKWDDTGSIFGERYKGFIAIVTTADGELVAAKTSFPNWDRALSRALAMKTGSWVDRDLNPATKPR